MSTTSGSSQDGITDGTAETKTIEPLSATPRMSMESSSSNSGKDIPSSPLTGATASAEAGPSAGSSSPSSHHESNVETSTATAFKDKNEQFTKGQSKRKLKKSQGSSRYRVTSDVDSQQSPSQEDSITNENEEELDFEEEEYESLEEGEEESDKEEETPNFNNLEWATGDSKESNIKGTKEKSKKKNDDDEDEDGEVNSDDDLEEGEVKEDDSDTGGSDDEANGQKKLTKKIVKTLNANNNQQQQAKTSICRFFAKGQCTWGLNCRFLHVAAPPVLTLPLKLPNQRGFPYQVGLNPTGLHPTGMHPTGAHPTGVHPAGSQGVATGALALGPHPTGHHTIPRPPLNRHQAAALAGTTIHPPQPSHPPPSSQASSSNTDSAWVRGLRNAKEMLVKANKRKEEESDFEKRFNANPEDEGTSHSKHSHHSRESPDSGDYGDRRSPHNYHARDREKRSHREATRRDYNREGRDVRDTREREPRDRERDNTEREPRDDYWNNSEYERRRRLAFESAPWNEEQSPPLPAPSRGNVRPREAAEMYRDPWRRSKSPQAKWSGGRRADVSTASKRSHSMSSISDSESGSGPSGSESISGSEGSFSGSEASYSDASQVSGRSPREERHKTKSGKSSSRTPRDANKPRPKQTADQIPHHSRDRGGGAPPPPPKSGPARDKMGSVPMNKSRSTRISVDEEPSGSGPRKKSGPVSPPPPVSKPRRDSWSDSDSGSMSQSDSSLYSGSESCESDAFSGASDAPLEDDRRSKGYRSRRDMKPHQSSNRQTYDSSSRRAPQQRSRTSNSPQPPSSSSSHHANPKRMKMSAGPSSSRDNNSMKHRHSSTLSNEDLPAPTQTMSSKKHPPNSPSDGPKKNPIKMTFKKKHSNLKTDRVIAAKLNGGRDENESGEEEESDQPNSGIGRQRTSSTDDEGGTLNEDDPVKKKTSYEHHSSFSDDDEDEDDSRSKHRDNERQSSSPSPSSSSKVTSKDGSTRREHLLKQLEAVEAMIAKKKAKLQ